MMETRKRAASERPATVEVEVANGGAAPSALGSAPQKQTKLVLKPPKFITEAKVKKPKLQAFSSLLEGALQLETAEEVLEQLLQVNGQSEPVLSRAGEADMTSSIKLIGKLWKKFESSVSVCCVLVRTLVLVTRRAKGFTKEAGLHGNVQTLSLSMIEHGGSSSNVYMCIYMHTACIHTIVIDACL